jgi:branched-chain amino acid transport system substrate-binding protein
VKYIVEDDGGDPARGRSEVQDLVESKKVIAFVYNSAPLAGQGTVDYLTQKQVPVIGSEGTSEWFYSSPVFFPQMTSGSLVGASTTASAASQTIPKGLTKLGLITCSDGIQICEESKKVVPEWAPKVGYTYVYTGSASLAQPDYTAECLAARNAGAQVLTFAMDANSIERFAKSCTNIGYRPTFAVSQHVASDALAQEPMLQGVAGTAMVAPWFDKANPAVAEFQAAMAAYATGVSLTGSPSFGWASAKLFEKAAQHLGDQPTAAQVLDGLWSIRNDTLGGLTMPLTFSRNQIAPRPLCYYRYTVNGGSYVLVDGGDVHCL